MISVHLKKKDDLQRSLRRLKKIMLREKVFDELRKRRYFQKPSTLRRARKKAAQFKAMIQQRHADW